MEFELYVARLKNCFDSLNSMALENVISEVKNTLKNGHHVYLIGNGGSAATASHFATDLNKIQRQHRLKGSAICLSDNSSMLTMIANDFDFNSVYRFQLEIGANNGDTLVAISASGNSKNLVDAVEYCNSVGVNTISLTGFDGGLLSEISKLAILAKTKIGDYGIAEDAHSVICHYVTEKIRNSEK